MPSDGDVFAHRPALATADWFAVAWRAVVSGRGSATA